jgi:TatD DNase family protein
MLDILVLFIDLSNKIYEIVRNEREFMFIDTHCHLEMLAKDGERTALSSEEIQQAKIFIDRARANSVEKIITIGTSLVDSLNCIAIAQAFPSVFATVAIHPNDITSAWLDDFKALKALVSARTTNKIVAIGECGIDLYHNKETLAVQKDVFKAHIDLALETGLPLSIHSRDAFDEILSVLDVYKHAPLKGVMHCFTGDLAFAHEVMRRGFYLGIGGTITYPKNTALREVVTALRLDRIVLETDAPFLTPQYKRGQPNEPAEIKVIGEYIATLIELDVNEVALTTTNNAQYLFGI